MERSSKRIAVHRLLALGVLAACLAFVVGVTRGPLDDFSAFPGLIAADGTAGRVEASAPDGLSQAAPKPAGATAETTSVDALPGARAEAARDVADLRGRLRPARGEDAAVASRPGNARRPRASRRSEDDRRTARGSPSGRSQAVPRSARQSADSRPQPSGPGAGVRSARGTPSAHAATRAAAKSRRARARSTGATSKAAVTRARPSRPASAPVRPRPSSRPLRPKRSARVQEATTRRASPPKRVASQPRSQARGPKQKQQAAGHGPVPAGAPAKGPKSG
jgi:hypothetical protein